MGWGRFLLLGDLGQQLDIEDHKEDLHKLKDEIKYERSRESRKNKDKINQLEDEIDELRLVVTALSRLLVSKRIIKTMELKSVKDELDILDGSLDGKMKQ